MRRECLLVVPGRSDPSCPAGSDPERGPLAGHLRIGSVAGRPDRVALDERIPYDETGLAVRTGNWLTRWQPIAIHFAMLTGVKREGIAWCGAQSDQQSAVRFFW